MSEERQLPPRDYPWAGHPRQFSVLAMPNGDDRYGVVGPILQVIERRGEMVPGLKLLSRAEAEQLRDELCRALAALELAEDMAEPGVPVDAGGWPTEPIGGAPRAYTGPWPNPDFRSLAAVDAVTDDAFAGEV